MKYFFSCLCVFIVVIISLALCLDADKFGFSRVSLTEFQSRHKTDQTAKMIAARHEPAAEVRAAKIPSINMGAKRRRATFRVTSNSSGKPALRLNYFFYFLKIVCVMDGVWFIAINALMLEALNITWNHWTGTSWTERCDSHSLSQSLPLRIKFVSHHKDIQSFSCFRQDTRGKNGIIVPQTPCTHYSASMRPERVNEICTMWESKINICAKRLCLLCHTPKNKKKLSHYRLKVSRCVKLLQYNMIVSHFSQTNFQLPVKLVRYCMREHKNAKLWCNTARVSRYRMKILWYFVIVLPIIIVPYLYETRTLLRGRTWKLGKTEITVYWASPQGSLALHCWGKASYLSEGATAPLDVGGRVRSMQQLHGIVNSCGGWKNIWVRKREGWRCLCPSTNRE